MDPLESSSIAWPRWLRRSVIAAGSWLSLPQWLPVPVTVAVMLLSLLAWKALRTQRQLETRWSVQRVLHTTVHSLDLQMQERVRVLDRMAGRMAQWKGITEASWSADADRYVQDYGGYEAIEWVDRDLVVRWVAPRRGNESAVGLDIKLNPKRKATFEEARKAGKPVLTTSVQVAQHGIGYLLIVPVPPSQDSPGGFVVAVIRGQLLLADLLSRARLDGYAVAVAQDGAVILPWRSGVERWQEGTDLPMFGRTWRIMVRPTAEQLKREESFLPAYVLWGGWLVAILLGTGMRSAQKAYQDRRRLAASTKALQHISARQEAILESANAAIIATGTDGTIQVFNRGAEKLLGYRAEEVLGKKGSERFLGPGDLLRWAEDVTQRPGITQNSGLYAILSSLMGGRTAERECTYVRKDGTQIPVLLSAAALVDASGNPVGTVSVATDLTARKQMEEILLEREARFRALIENGRDVLTITNATGVFLYLSPSVKRVLGWSQEELVGRNFREFLPTVEIAGTEARYKQLVDGPQLGSAEFLSRFACKDGTFRYMDVFSRNQIGNPVVQGVVSVLQDVTDRMKAEENLGRERDFTNAIVETVGSLVVVADWEGRIARFNRACEQVTGYPAVEVLGRQFWDVFVPEPRRAQVAGEFVSRKAADYPISSVSVWITKSGEERTFEWSETVLLDEEGQPEFVIGTGLDITEKLRMEKLKNEFVSTVSHELRTPLTSIRGSLALLAGGIAGQMSGQARTLIDIALKNSERLGRLINDILDIEKIESGRMDFTFRELELKPFLERAVEANRAYGTSLKVEFALGPCPEPASLSGDEDRLMQVLANLLSNAAKFSPAGGTVDLSAKRQGASLRVEVRDHGPGIPEEFRSQIFQRFAQADASDTRLRGGTGLGLAVSKAIVERHNGTIGFEDAPGGGSVFFFELPELRPEPDPPSFSGPRVLHVEPNADVFRVVSLVLRDVARVEQASSLEEARRRLAAQRYDLAILDLGLPDGSGLELLPELRPAPVVIFSAEEVHPSLLREGDQMLVKSRTTNEQLLETIRAILRRAGLAGLPPQSV